MTGKFPAMATRYIYLAEVTVNRLPDLEKDKLDFSTEYLHVIPDKDQADTDHPVTIVTAR